MCAGKNWKFSSTKLHDSLHSFRLSLVVVAAPLFLFIFLRLLVHHIFGIRLGYAGFTDYDFIPPSLIAFVVLFVTLAGDAEPTLFLQKKILKINLASLFLFIWITFTCQPLVSYNHPIFILFWFALAAFGIGSSVFIGLPLSFFWKSPQRIAILPASVMASSNLFALTLLDSFWDPLTRFTGILVYKLLKPFFSTLLYSLNSSSGAIRIEHFTTLRTPVFSVVIGRGCGGLEGICFFATVIGLLATIDPKRFRVGGWLWLSAVGLLYIYCLNVLRLGLFFSASFATAKWVGNRTLVRMINTLFHSGAGWVLYSIGLLLFFGVVFRRTSKVPSPRAYPTLRREISQV